MVAPPPKPPVPLPLFSSIQIASPCDVPWDSMAGDHRTRFCSQCSLHVHNLSEMSAESAEAFLRERLPTGRVCVRFFRRADGTVLTQDCPLGLARLKRLAAIAWAKSALALVTLLSSVVALALQQPRRGELLELQPVARLCRWLGIDPATSVPLPAMGKMQTMGAIALPVQTPRPPALVGSSTIPGKVQASPNRKPHAQPSHAREEPTP